MQSAPRPPAQVKTNAFCQSAPNKSTLSPLHQPALSFERSRRLAQLEALFGIIFRSQRTGWRRPLPRTEAYADDAVDFSAQTALVEIAFILFAGLLVKVETVSGTNDRRVIGALLMISSSMVFAMPVLSAVLTHGAEVPRGAGEPGWNPAPRQP